MRDDITRSIKLMLLASLVCLNIYVSLHIDGSVFTPLIIFSKDLFGGASLESAVAIICTLWVAYCAFYSGRGGAGKIKRSLGQEIIPMIVLAIFAAIPMSSIVIANPEISSDTGGLFASTTYMWVSFLNAVILILLGSVFLGFKRRKQDADSL